MELSIKNKLAGFAAAGLLALAMAPTAALGVGALTADTSITVGGLDAGDSAKYYQIIGQDLTTTDPAHIGTQQWKLTASVDSNEDGIVDGTEAANFGHVDKDDDSVLGLWVDELAAKDGATPSTKTITKRMMNAIASAVSSNGAAGTTMAAAGADGKVTAKIAADKLGLYMVVAVPGNDNVDTLYKPVFVSADYDQDAATDKITLAEDVTDYQGKPQVFKRSKLAVDKRSGARDEDGVLTGSPKDSKHDAAVGDVVDFIITANVPTYSANYDSAVFKITDALTPGLELSKADGTLLTTADTGEITVTIDGYDDAVRWEDDEHASDYKVSIANTREFVVEFRNDKNWAVNANETFDADEESDDDKKNDRDGFLYTVKNNPKVTIAYKAKVTSEAAEQVNQMDNAVTLKYSESPADTTGVGELTGKTRHYTFGLDATVLGSDGSQNPSLTSELRKIAVAANGDAIEECVTKDIAKVQEEKKFSWLQDAEFELKQVQRYVNDDPATSGSFDDCDDAVVKFNANGVRTSEGGSNPKSDANGHITMRGLDAGVYELKEVNAPVGYTFDPSKAFIITITPTYVLDTDKSEILASYKVDIACKDVKGDDQVSSTTYTANADAGGKPISFLDDKGAANVAAGMGVTIGQTDETALIVNKELGVLPATGGSGILFYAFLGVVIMGLAVFLSRRNRKAAGATGATA